MRKAAFVVFDIDNSILDRLNLDLITDISGVGFKLKLSTIDGDIESIVTKVVQDKQEIKFKIHLINRPYEQSSILEQWLEKYSKTSARMALEYSDGTQKRYAEGKVVSLTKTEKDEYGQLVREMSFRPLTPFFSNIENRITIRVAAVGKSYPFRYPYSYGLNKVTNNEINNPYILDVPVTVKLTGSVYEPTVYLLNEDGQEYSRVTFPGITLTSDDYIIINSAERKIYHYDLAGGLKDYSAFTDPSQDTFLRAQSGVSRIMTNLIAGTDTGELTGSWRQYGL